MGTSTNRPSPNTPTWQPIKATIGNETVPVERQSAEIWRAAAIDRDAKLLSELGGETIAYACSVAGRSTTAAEAMRDLQREIVTRKSVGLTVDMAKRALARAASTGAGAAGFARELFSEAVSYYASRDLPSVVAALGRVATNSDAIALKDGLRDVARSAVSRAGPPPREARGWRGYVSEVIEDLVGRGSR
jgi:hypothetical protein